VVFIEGVTCTRRESIGRIAFAIWVEAQKDERLGRGIDRDGEGRRGLWHRWMEEEDKFFAVDKTRLRADLIVPGTQ
jgi:uridine kinase